MCVCLLCVCVIDSNYMQVFARVTWRRHCVCCLLALTPTMFIQWVHRWAETYSMSLQNRNWAIVGHYESEKVALYSCLYSPCGAGNSLSPFFPLTFHFPIFYSLLYFSLFFLIMAALCNRGGALYFCPVVSLHLHSSVFFSSPNLSGCRLDVYHTLTHGVALVRI